MKPFIQSLASFAILVGISTSSEAQAVWVVDKEGGAGSNFLSSDVAVNAASDGDIILIREGEYYHDSFFGFPRFVVDGKSLVFIAERDADVSMIFMDIFSSEHSVFGFNANNLSATQTVGVRGIAVNGIRGLNNLGTLWLEDLNADESGLDSSYDFHLVDCATTVINRCKIVGQSNIFPPPFPANPGVLALRSPVYLFDTELVGGIAGTPGSDPPPAYYPGALITDSFLYASGGRLGDCFGDPLVICTDLVLVGATTEAVILDAPGNVMIEGGTSTTLPGIARSFEANSPVREGEVLTFDFIGAPGDFAILNVSANPAGNYFASVSGSVVLESPLLLLRVMGQIPASGTLSKSFTLNELGAGVEGITLYSQGSFANASGLFVGGGSMIVLLDDSI